MMTKRNTRTTGPADEKLGVIYIRVSSVDQEKEGYSLSAQLKVLKDYAVKNEISILKEFQDVETAKTTGRKNFVLMMNYFKENPRCRILLTEKVDRLYRNMRDPILLEELGVDVRFVKQGMAIQPDSSPSDKLNHNVHVALAKYYIDNLSQEARKGMLAKAELGLYPSRAPIGYRNIKLDEGRRIIMPNPEMAPIVRKLFELFSCGDISVSELTRIAKLDGLKTKHKGRVGPLSRSAIHNMLRRRIYYGEFEWRDELIQGKHEPLISRALWQQVQNVLDRRNEQKPKVMKHDFAFSRLVRCGHCGCSMVGEVHKGRYIYYSCSGYKGKCPEPYIRESKLDEEFCDQLGALEFDEVVLEYLKETVGQLSAEEKDYHVKKLEEMKNRFKSLEKRSEEMYEDKLNGVISAELYLKKTDACRREMEELRIEISVEESGDSDGFLKGVELLELVRKARFMYLRRSSKEKRKLIRNLLSNSSWKDGRLSVEFRQPYDMIIDTNKEYETKKAAGDSSSSLFTAWRGGWDSN